VTIAAVPTYGVALLTRTTLQIDRSLVAEAMAQLIQALQRVPGVLFAEPALEGSRAIVSHDAGVSPASLTAAALGVGVHAIIADAEPVVATGIGATSQLKRVSVRQLILVSLAVFAVLALTDVLVPDSTAKHWVLAVLTWLIWALFLAQMFVRRRI